MIDCFYWLCQFRNQLRCFKQEESVLSKTLLSFWKEIVEIFGGRPSGKSPVQKKGGSLENDLITRLHCTESKADMGSENWMIEMSPGHLPFK